MKKRFTGILLAFMMIAMTVFTGCALVTRNWDKYYNTVVAKIVDADKKEITITKRELITAYNSYGYYYEQYYSQSKQQAYENTLTQLETRKLLLNDAERLFTEKYGYILSDKEKTYLWQQTNSAIEDNFYSYLDQVRENQTSSSSQSEDELKFEGYEKKAKLVITGYVDHDGVNIPQYRIEKTQPLEKLLSDFEYDPSFAKDIENEEDKIQIYNNLFNLVQNMKDEDFSSAFNLYRKALRSSEEGLKIEDKSNQALFLREIDRIYKINYENYLTEKYSEYFQKKTNDDDQSPNTNSDVTVKDILTLYTNKVLSSYHKYEIANGSYEDDMLSDLSTIYYFKSEPETQFYKVAHILFKFDDNDQLQTYNQAKKDLKNKKISQEEYDFQIQSLKNQITPLVREKGSDGVYTEIDEKDRKTYEENVTLLYDHIKGELDQTSNFNEKAAIFNELIYKYNEDPGIMNAQFNYVMGLNQSEAVDGESDVIETKDGTKYKSYSKMVSEFTLAGAELFRQDQPGAISEPIMTENGFHILFYEGRCENLYSGIVESYKKEGEPMSLADSTIETLYNTRLNAFVDKTIFDVLYEELTKDNFATFESDNIGLLREKCDFYHYYSNYKDLF